MTWKITWLVNGELTVTFCVGSERIARKYAEMRRDQGFIVIAVDCLEVERKAA